MRQLCLFVLLFSCFAFAKGQKDSIRLGLPLGHSGAVNSAVFSPDDNYIVTVSNDKIINVWSSKNGKLLWHIEGHTDKIWEAKFSPDSKMVATASDDNTIKIWDIKSARLLLNLPEFQSVSNVEFSPDGKLLLYSVHEIIKIWNVETGTLFQTLIGHNSKITDIHFSSDGMKIASACFNGEAKVWGVKTGIFFFDLLGHKSVIFSIEYSTDSKKIITASSDGTAKIWDAATGTMLSSLDGHTKDIYCARFSPNGNLAVTGSADSTAKVWNVGNGELLHDLKGHLFGVGSVQISLDGTKIVTASHKDKIGKIWDMGSGRLLFNLNGHIGGINSVCFNNSGNMVLTSSYLISRVWSTENGKLLWTLRGYADHLDEVNLSANLVLTSGGGTATPKIWDLHRGLLVLDLGYMSYGESHFCGDGTRVISSLGKKIYIKQVETGNVIQKIQLNTNFIQSVQVSADDKYVVTIGDEDSIANIWEVNSGTLLHSLVGHKEPINTAKFSPNGKYVVTTSWDDNAILWNAHTGHLIWNLSGHSSSVNNARFSSDNLKLVTASHDKTATVWDAESGASLVNLIGHSEEVTDAQFSSDGKKIVTSSVDKSCKVWDVASGRLIKTLSGHSNSVSCAQFTSDGSKVLSASIDGSIILFDVTSGKNIVRQFILSTEGVFRLLPSNHYQCTPNAAKLLYYIRGLQTIGFDQLDVKYNRPDKVLTELGNAFGNPDTALINSYYKAWQKRVKKLGVDTTSFEEGFSVPEGDFKNREVVPYEQTSTDGKLQLKVWGMDSTYKLDRFNVWVNEVPVYGQRGINIRKDSLNTIERAVTLTLSEGENKIETSVLNVNGIESYRVPLYVRYTPKQPAKEKLYFVGIGIDKYREPGHNLQYSAKDIRDLAVKLKEQYGNDIEIDTLLDENVNVENIKALKKHLLQSTVNDKVIVAFSGHGLLSKDYDYYLSTYNVHFNQPEQGGLPYEDLEWLLDSIPARKKLMLIDACHSGELDKEEVVQLNHNNDTLLAENKGTKGAYITYTGDNKRLGLKNSFELMQELFANVNRGTGATVIAASGGTQFAQEHGNLKNGVFTYSILELMQQKKEVKVSELKTTAGKRVEELTNGNQKPTSRNENIEFDWKVW